MPQCKNCKHWNKSGYASILDVRYCTKAKHVDDVTEWHEDESAPEVCRKVKPEFADLKMFVTDASGYKAWLMTKADFCCSHFEGAGEVEAQQGEKNATTDQDCQSANSKR